MPEPSSPDDPPTLVVLGGVAYSVAMVLHEVLGHGTLCYAAGGHPLLSSVATQCQVQSWPMVLAGPAFNLIAGAALAWRIPASPTRCSTTWLLLWLVMGFNLLIATGYLLLGGVA